VSLVLLRLFLPCGPLNFAYNNYTQNITQTFVKIRMLQKQKNFRIKFLFYSKKIHQKITTIKIPKLIISNPKTVFAIPMSLVHLTYTTLWKARTVIGWKFLKKLWCCVGGGNKVIYIFNLVDITKLPNSNSLIDIFFLHLSILQLVKDLP